MTPNNHGDLSSTTSLLGVLLVNLGTPQTPTPRAIRNYLREFLSDPRVIGIPRLIWLPILYGFVLTMRPRRIAPAYRNIWLKEGSPLLVYTRKQQQALKTILHQRGLSKISIEIAMCYGQPSIVSSLKILHDCGVTRLIILPLYPQYSATTTAAAFDAIAKALKKEVQLPELYMLHDYHDNDTYIKACAARILESRRQNSTGDKLLFSFHGLPERNILLGDPYQSQCHKTASLIAKELNLKWHEWVISFQSRFGPAEWIKPYTDKTLCLLAKQGVKSIDVFCPGFASDCLETLEEMNLENRRLFIEAGGGKFCYIPALNDSTTHIECLANIVCDALGYRNQSQT